MNENQRRKRQPDIKPAAKIVGIGASAGGLEAFTELLRNLPQSENAAYILVQHLDPSHRSLLSELLARTTPLKVREITDKTVVEANQIYVIPPNSDLTITKGILRLSPREKTGGPARSIDSFLTSLAIDQKSNAIAVILSGAGSDGAQGLRAVKAAGGITFAQDERTAKYDSMPRAAVATGCVDFVLPPQKIAAELSRVVREPDNVKSRAAANAKRRRSQLPAKSRFERKTTSPAASWPKEPGDANLRKIFQLLRAKTGLDFTFYKSNTIRRRLTRRLTINKVKGLEEYVKFLRHHPEELDAVHQDLLINVTSFFRNPAVFENLKRKIFPKLVKQLSATDTLRIWIAGCSTGQEAYSIAMAYSEFVENTDGRVPVQIFASDVNGAILDFARAARYTTTDIEGVSTARLERFFAKEDGFYRVVKPIRDLVVFAQHNLLLDPPFTRVDLISCRNMLIYFEPALQQKIIPAFHYSLKPDGILLLGSSESIGQFHNLFATIDPKQRLYTKKPVSNWPRFDRPPAVPPGRKTLLQSVVAPVEINPADAQKEADRLVLHKYAPPGVVVNSDGEILQFRGDVGKYLKLPTGKASFHISKIARDGLSLILERAFTRAKREKKPVRESGICFDNQGIIHIEIVPLKLKCPCYLVLFEQSAAAPKPTASRALRGRVSGTEIKRIHELKNELSVAREHINSLQEEHDTSIEELQASNEEVQSANEELQSLNEELETSNEELESANEELTTLNEELATRNSELRESEMRLREQAALLEMAPLLARSPKDRIILWSRGAEQMYGYTAEEAVGQSAHILLDTKTPEPLNKINAKLHAQGHWEGEVSHRRKDGKRLMVATQWVVHYDSNKKIHAILEVNTDITARKQAERALSETEEFNRTILESSPDCVKVLDLEGRVVFVNPAGRKLLESAGAEARAKAYWPGLWEGEAREHAEKAYRSAILGKSGHFVGPRLTAKGTVRWWDVVVRPIPGTSGNFERILIVMRDVTEHKNEQLAIAERAQLTALRAQIASEIAGDTALIGTLQRVAEMLSGDLKLAVVQIWVADHHAESLNLTATGGEHAHAAHIDDRIAFGHARIGKIAQQQKVFCTDDFRKDPSANGTATALPGDVTSFAGYPLVVGERAVGVLAIYGKTAFGETVLAELSLSARGIAQFIHRKKLDEKLRTAQDELSRYNVGLEKLAAERTSSLQQLVEQMEEFSYSVSHDLRAPARAMEGYATALLEDYADRLDATGKEYLERIVRNSSRMDRMIREILTYSRISRNQISLRPVALDLLVREIVEQYPGVQPFSSGIDIATELGSVMGHEPSLMQAISNLLSNACKFVAPNTTPRCRVWTERENGHVKLIIKDNGIGIRPEHQHRLFGVFERLHSESQYEGNGIGLAIVRKAVERMGGKVGVESDGVNGSQFWIQLPAAESENATRVEERFQSRS